MNKSFLMLIFLFLLLSNCEKEPNPFLISKQHIGLLTDSTQVKNLDKIYINDSIVWHDVEVEFIGNSNDIEIFEKGGKKLLSLSPSHSLDSTATIQNIRIFDPRYKTEKNISMLSTFKDIAKDYKVSRIDNLINSVVVSVNEINASFTIDKKELPANLRFDMDLSLEANHIPDNAKIKYFFINWNKTD